MLRFGVLATGMFACGKLSAAVGIVGIVGSGRLGGGGKFTVVVGMVGGADCGRVEGACGNGVLPPGIMFGSDVMAGAIDKLPEPAATGLRRSFGGLEVPDVGTLMLGSRGRNMAGFAFDASPCPAGVPMRMRLSLMAGIAGDGMLGDAPGTGGAGGLPGYDAGAGPDFRSLRPFRGQPFDVVGGVMQPLATSRATPKKP